MLFDLAVTSPYAQNPAISVENLRPGYELPPGVRPLPEILVNFCPGVVEQKTLLRILESSSRALNELWRGWLSPPTVVSTPVEISVSSALSVYQPGPGGAAPHGPGHGGLAPHPAQLRESPRQPLPSRRRPAPQPGAADGVPGGYGRARPSTVNVRLSAVRKMVSEARKNGMLGAEEAANLTEVPNIPQKGTRLGNWLTREQARELLAVPDRSTLKGKRDYVFLAMLVGCALRREELTMLDVDTIQLRDGRWVLADLEGKGRRVRTVAIPVWVKQGINAWMTAAGVEDGRLLRAVSKGGKVKESMSGWAVWSVVEQSAREIGIERFGAHDLRRTCAKLCRKNGGNIEQIKFLLGHSSIQTTERYLGSEQEIEIAVNDNLGL